MNSGTIASVDGGDHVYFNAAGAFAGAESVLYDTAYVAARGSGWVTRGADPALTPTGLLAKSTLGLSEDGTKAVVVTSRALAPGAVEGGSNLYVRDLTQPSSCMTRSSRFRFRGSRRSLRVSGPVGPVVAREIAGTPVTSPSRRVSAD
ncbi:MAG: hypothetical protein WBD40_17145 [Tepidisphaeraceae bacterium]